MANGFEAAAVQSLFSRRRWCFWQPTKPARFRCCRICPSSSCISATANPFRKAPNEKRFAVNARVVSFSGFRAARRCARRMAPVLCARAGQLGVRLDGGSRGSDRCLPRVMASNARTQDVGLYRRIPRRIPWRSLEFMVNDRYPLRDPFRVAFGDP